MKKPRRVDWWYVDRVIASPMVRAVAVLVALLFVVCMVLIFGGCSPPQEPVVTFGSRDVEIRQLQDAVRTLQRESEERKAEEARLIPQLDEHYRRLKALNERLKARRTPTLAEPEVSKTREADTSLTVEHSVLVEPQ